MPKSFLWQHVSSADTCVQMDTLTLAAATQVLFCPCRAWAWLGCHGRAGGSGHLVRGVLADRWLSGRRAYQAETDLRTLAAGDHEAHRNLSDQGEWQSEELATRNWVTLVPGVVLSEVPGSQACQQQNSQHPRRDERTRGHGPRGKERALQVGAPMCGQMPTNSCVTSYIQGDL